MKKSPQNLLWLLLILFSTTSFSQTPNISQHKTLDSIKQKIEQAVDDSVKIRLTYLFGLVQKTNRTDFWDSLYLQTQKHQLPYLEMKTGVKLGRILSSQGKVKQGLELLNKNMKLAEKIGNTQEVLSIMYWAAYVYTDCLNYNEALNLCYKGLRVAEKLNDKKNIAAFKDISARIYYKTGDKQRAINQSLEALRVYSDLKMNQKTVSILCDIGTYYKEMGDTASCITYYFKTLKFAPEFKQTIDGMEIYKAVGSAYTHKKQYDSAEYNIEKALAISKVMKYTFSEIGALEILANLSYLQNNLTKAKKQITEVIELSEKNNFIIQIPTAANLLKTIYLKEKNYRDALEAYELEVKARAKITDEKMGKEVLEREFVYNLEKKENENKLLASQNQIQSLQLSQNRYLLVGLAGLIFLLLVIGYLYLRQNKLQAAHQNSQLEQKLLRSQMNPHFIFNSLQAIQNYILKNDKQEAVSYLSSFANVTRHVLENSRMELIPLKKEINLLQNYLQLQKLRFKNRFEYEIKIEESIDIEHTSIPPMLAQPFIENAVEHGFHNINNDGKITISYTLKDNTLLLEITDNGTGMKDGYAESKQHQSLAMEITRERVELINKKAKHKIIFKISEAFPQSTERKGLKVNFSFPLNS